MNVGSFDEITVPVRDLRPVKVEVVRGFVEAAIQKTSDIVRIDTESTGMLHSVLDVNGKTCLVI